MNLAGLLTSAAAGTATLAEYSIKLDAAARLWTAVSEDRVPMSLWAWSDLGRLSVTAETVEPEVLVVTVGGRLRYLLDTGDGAYNEAVERLCTTPGCLTGSIGRALLTRVCHDHLDAIVPGTLPNPGDDIFPGMEGATQLESRQLRLAAWQEEIATAERQAAGHRNVLETLRQAPESPTSAPAP
jgi:hypothetical protein